MRGARGRARAGLTPREGVGAQLLDARAEVAVVVEGLKVSAPPPGRGRSHDVGPAAQ